MRTILIDGDILAYKFAAASEQTIDWGDGVVTSHAALGDAKANLDEHIRGLTLALLANAYVVALSDPTGANFRKDLSTTYKVARKDARQPMVRRALEAHLIEAHRAKHKPGLEGDDVLGILATHPKLHRGEKIVVSPDKDMRTVPCKLWWDGQMRVVDAAAADHWHLTQTLTGDRVDGYEGCPGIGEKRAERILTTAAHPNLWGTVVSTFEKAGKTADDALLQARLARILRAEDYDFKNGVPILWTPN